MSTTATGRSLNRAAIGASCVKNSHCGQPSLCPVTGRDRSRCLLPLGVSKSLEALSFLYGPEAMAYLDGAAYRGVDPNHQELPLPDHVLDGEEHQLALHGWAGIKDERYEMGHPRLVQIDQPTRDFVTVAGTALDIATQLQENNPVRVNLINALDAAFLLLDLREPLGAAFYESVHAAHARIEGGHC